MRARAAEAHVRIGVAQNVERHRVVEYLFIEIGRPVDHHHPLALLDLHSAKLGVGQRGALKGGHRGGPSDYFVDGGGRPQLLVELPLVTELSEGVHAMGDRVAGRLVAGHRQQDDEESEFVVGEFVALDVGLHQLGDQVVAGVGASVGGHLHGVHDQLDGGTDRVVGREFRIDVADHLVGPVEEFLALFLRHPHQSGNGLEREFAGDLFDEVAGALLRRGVGNGAGPLAELGAKQFDGAGRESAGDDLAQVGVMRGVHVEQHELSALDVLFDSALPVAR